MLNWMMSAYHKWKLPLCNFVLRKPQVSAVSGQCCIRLDTQELTFAYMRYTKDKPVLEHCASYPYDSAEGLKELLSDLVKQYQLKKMPCSWVLAPQDYQLLQMDALPVAADEFQAAIRWKIKDALRFPLEDVVIDQFALPPSKISAKNKMMVVAAQSSYLEQISEKIKVSGLDLGTIDIPELALRSIMALHEQENQSHALVYVQDATVQLFITCHQQLYFFRSLEFPWDGSDKIPEAAVQYIEQLTREIQRSFDYYQSQWRQPAPTQVTFAATQFIAADTLSQLSHLLSLPVQWLSFDDILLAKQSMNQEQQGKYLPLIGELCRQGYTDHATTN